MRRFACALSINLTRPLLKRVGGAGLLVAALISPAWAGSVTYSYDTLGRITQAAYSTGVVIAYVYDAAGNRTSFVISGAPS
jgi:YD repeat-containing protein